MRPYLLATAIIGVAAQPGLGEVVFDDGETHVIDADITDEPVRISNETSIVHRGQIRSNLHIDVPGLSGCCVPSMVTLDQASTLSIEGKGRMEAIPPIDFEAALAIHATEASRISIESGSINGSGIHLEDSELLVSGGEVVSQMSHNVNLFAGITAVKSEVFITGGILETRADYLGYGLHLIDSNATILGGKISSTETSSAVVENGTLRFSGGELFSNGGLDTHAGVGVGDGGEFLMNGGHIIVDGGIVEVVGLSVRGRAQISGGRISFLKSDANSETTIVARSKAEVIIQGSDFNYPMFERITDPEGTITGTLADGNEFSWTFERDPDAMIVLIPEPSAITLSVIGFLGLLGYRRKKNAA